MIRSLKGLYHLLEAILANVWFGFPGRELSVIGVTGTDGKTTTTTLIYEILREAGFHASMITSVSARIGNKNYDTGFHVTSPRAWSVQKYLRDAVNIGDTHMVLEVTSHALSQHRVWGIPFAVGVLTNVTHEHLDWHKTFEAYFATKVSLLKSAKVAVIRQAEYKKARNSLTNQTVIVYDEVKSIVKTQLQGAFNKENAEAAWAASKAIGINEKTIETAIANFKGVPGRLEIVNKKPYTVIVDFAHTPNAITQVLKTVKEMTKRKLIHVFGSAALRDASKRPLMGAASARFSDVIILTEEDYRSEDVNYIINQIEQGIPKNKKVYKEPDRQKAIELALSLVRPGDCVILTGKGHEKSLARGRKEYPWSDQEAVRKALSLR